MGQSMKILKDIVIPRISTDVCC